MGSKRYEVTEKVIDRAVQRDSSHCVVADAIRECKPEATAVAVDLQTIRFSDKKTGKRYTFLTPPACQRTLVAFDQGEEIAPFGFYLGPPVHVNTAKIRTQADGKRRRDYKPRTISSRGKGQVPIVNDGVALPANAALATGPGGNGKGRAAKGKVRQYGLRQLKA